MNDSVLHWLNEPPEWESEGDRLSLRTAPETDFWRGTLVDYVKDSGHFYYEPVTGDFIATVRFSGAYRDQYDQAGLFVRIDEENWMKCGIEIVNDVWTRDYKVNGSAYLIMAGLTSHGWSEWSTLPQLPTNPDHLWMRVIRDRDTLFVDWSFDGTDYSILKLFAFPGATELQVGRYAASPAGEGFTASFDSYTLVRGATEPRA
jgi:regulation of enolase protein 1 (concanavalin A-like superfamily)